MKGERLCLKKLENTYIYFYNLDIESVRIVVVSINAIENHSCIDLKMNVIMGKLMVDKERSIRL